MQVIQKTIQFLKFKGNPNFEDEKNKLISFLKELKTIEANLWGVNIIHLQNGEEEILEDSNHLIYLISHSKEHSRLEEVLKLKEIKEFKKDLENLKNDFNFLKKRIVEKTKLKNLISNFTIKLVEPKNYLEMENVFLLEKKLYEIIETQDDELKDLFKNISKIKINEDEKTQVLIDSLKNIRTIFAGHHDLHKIWNDERKGFSNTSNIIHELLRIIKGIDENNNNKSN